MTRMDDWWCRQGGALIALFCIVMNGLLYWLHPWIGSLFALGLSVIMFVMWCYTHRVWKANRAAAELRRRHEQATYN